jgi:Ca2+-binding RTX toxin-like protein
LIGNDGNDSIYGEADADEIFGNAGNDTMFGNAGNDTLTGGAGTDYFAFNSAAEGIDLITDFDANGNDVIAINTTGFGNEPAVITDVSPTTGSPLFYDLFSPDGYYFTRTATGAGSPTL